MDHKLTQGLIPAVSGFPLDVLNIKSMKVFSFSNSMPLNITPLSLTMTNVKILDFKTHPSMYTIITGMEIGFISGTQLYDNDGQTLIANSHFDIRFNGISAIEDNTNVILGSSVMSDPYVKLENLFLSLPIFNSSIQGLWFQDLTDTIPYGLTVYCKISGYYYSV